MADNTDNYEGMDASDFESYEDYETYKRISKNLSRNARGKGIDRMKPAKGMSIAGMKPIDTGANTAQVTLKAVNGIAQIVPCQMFMFANSVSKVFDPTFSTDNASNLYNPLGSTQNFAATLGSNTVGWTNNGSLKYTLVDAGGGTGANNLTLSCTTSSLNYRTLFETSGLNSFQIYKIRYGFANDVDLDQDIIYITKTAYGNIKQQAVTPRNYFNPAQFQTKICDIDVDFLIDAEHGIVNNVLASSNITYTLFLKGINKNTLSVK